MLENGIENNISIDVAAKSRGPQKAPGADDDVCTIRDLSVIQAIGRDDNEKDQFLVDRVVRQVKKNVGTTNVKRRYEYTTEEDKVEPAHNFPQRFVSRFWKHISRGKPQTKS